MSTNKTGVSGSPPRSCGPDRTRDANNWSQSHTSQVPFSIESGIMDLLSTRLSPDQLQSKYNKLELLKKSSFYIMVRWKDVIQSGNQPIFKSTLIIDTSTFQSLKRDSKCQVKIQLALLEMLYTELIGGREELVDTFVQKGSACLMLGEAVIQKKILRLHQAAEDFDAAVNPWKLHVRRSLLPQLESQKLSEFQLVLEAEKPVMFNREQSQAFRDSVVLHWYIAEQGQHKPDEEFEIHCKLINLTSEIESGEFGVLTCSDYVIKITNLRPGCSYEFSVKRLNNAGMVYGVRNDTIVLTTTSV